MLNVREVSQHHHPPLISPLVVALPAWILALGPVISAQSEFTIPFGNIALLIVYLLAPCAVGLLTQRFLPK